MKVNATVIYHFEFKSFFLDFETKTNIIQWIKLSPQQAARLIRQLKLKKQNYSTIHSFDEIDIFPIKLREYR
jgi:hypothetical protein